MTKVSVDDQESKLHSSNHQKVGQVIDEIVTKLPGNRIVSEIVCDGEPVSILIARDTMEKHINDVDELRIRTTDKEVWILNGIDISISTVEKVKGSLIRTAELLRDEHRLAQGHQFLARCMEGIERFFEALTITRSVLHLNFDLIEVDGVSLTKMENQLYHILRAIHDCQQIEDTDSIADRLEYELLTNLSGWHQALRQLSASRHSNA